MTMPTDIHRVLELIEKELSADEARLQLGGKVPEGAIRLPLDRGFDLVVVGSTMDTAKAQEKLAELSASFFGAFEEATDDIIVDLDREQSALDEALEVLAGSAHALSAVVVDGHSPVLWGASFQPKGPEDVDDAIALTELEHSLGEVSLLDALMGPVDAAPALLQRIEKFRATCPDRDRDTWRLRLLSYDAIVDARQTCGDAHGRTRHVRHAAAGSYITRTFGGAYLLVMVFEAKDFSELHAEAALIHALPLIEKLTERLPPVDPGGGRVLKMRRLRPV